MNQAASDPSESDAPVRRVGTPERTAICVLLAVFAVIRLQGVGDLSPHQFQDSRDYLVLAETSLLQPRFWLGPRPVTVPLFYKLLAADPARIAVGQAVLATLTWAVLGVAMAAGLRRTWCRLGALVLILGFALVDKVTMWDVLVLSESVSLSLLAACTAAAMMLARRWRWPMATALGMGLALWSQARDTDAAQIGAMALLGSVVVIAFRGDRRWLAVCAWGLVVSAVGLTTADVAQRWRFPFYNVMGQRILPDADATRFFAERGMPASPALANMAGQWASSRDWQFYRDPHLEAFREWADRKGRATYLRWLLNRQADTLLQPWRERATLFAPDVRDYRSRSFDAPVGAWLGTWLLPTNNPRLVYAGLVLSLLAAWLATRGRSRPEQAVAAVLLAGALVLALLIYHGDAMEFRRHSLPVAVEWHLGVWLMLALAADGATRPPRGAHHD